MNLRLRSLSSAVLLLVAALLLVPAQRALAADGVTVGTVNASGTTVDVPVYVRDVSGPLLGMDQPAGSKIQSLSIRVGYSPASAVSSVTFERAGITSSLSPTFESHPATTGAIALLATFQESNNLIPFTLNASAPGDLVAHLVFTLSASAAPGSTIALTLDPALTQLTNDGGTTKETDGNGFLELTDGAIQVPPLTLTLTPSSVKMYPATTTQLAVTASAPVPQATTVSLTSSAPSTVSVPDSVVIPSGERAAIFTVNALALGGATITAALPQSLGGDTATASINVTEEPPPCATVIAPQLTAPATALSGASYTVAWTLVPSATEYVIEESTTSSFGTTVKQTVTTAGASFSHSVSAETRYYYRARAYNKVTGCSEISPLSNVVSVLVTVAPPAPAKRIITVVGSTPGENGAYFRTGVQLFNPSNTTMSGRIVYHPGGTSAGGNDPSLAYSLGAGKSLAYGDLLPALGVAGGVGSADMIADTGSAFPVALVRVFNDAGAAGTSGLTQELFAAEQALQPNQSGALIAPADPSRLRLNIGVRTLEAGASVTVTVRDASGNIVKTVPKTFPPSWFRQTTSSDFLEGYVLTGGEAITIRVDAGTLFVYGATTDNVTNDPSTQFARKIE